MANWRFDREIVHFFCSKTGHFQGRERNPNPNFLVRISSGGAGFFHVKGWGPKRSVYVLQNQGSGKEKAHKHKQNFPVIARVGGVLPTGWPGVKSLCTVCKTQ